MRFLLFILIAGAVALYFTNPTTDEVRAKLGGQVPVEISGAMAPTPATAPGDTGAPPPAPDQPAPPPGTPTTPTMPTMPAGAPPMDQPGMPTVPPAVTDAMSGEMQFERKDYYLFSIYKLTVAGQPLPGCIVGIAKQAIPITPDRCPA